MGYAASLTARAEQAAGDPNVSHEEVSRIAGAAARARADLVKVIEARHRNGRASMPAPRASSVVADLASILGGGP